MNCYKQREGKQDLDQQGFDYVKYWNGRYSEGSHSGYGSYGTLGEYKVHFINKFITENDIDFVIDFGCGDGFIASQLKTKYYQGFDVSVEAVFKTRKYKLIADLYCPTLFTPIFKSDLVICLDTLYHITDDSDYKKTLRDIFESSKKYVILYSSTHDEEETSSHVKHRKIIKDIPTTFDVVSISVNPFSNMSSAKFIVLKKRG